MDYLTSKEAGEKWGITSRMVNLHCQTGHVDGAIKKGNLWLIPVSTPKPDDRRRRDQASKGDSKK